MSVMSITLFDVEIGDFVFQDAWQKRFYYIRFQSNDANIHFLPEHDALLWEFFYLYQ